jgi:NADH-quinone oxidoreductase subunit J
MELAVFIVTAIIALVGGVAMLLSRNAVHSALYLLVNFAAIAVLYLLLRAPFLFVVQLTVYAGAIMVLFLFVVMLLGAERSEDEGDRVAWQRPLALVLGALLLAEAVLVFVAQGAQPEVAATPQAEAAGAPVQIGELLFTRYLLPFEITSIILLAAIIGVVVLHRRGANEPGKKEAA